MISPNLKMSKSPTVCHNYINFGFASCVGCLVAFLTNGRSKKCSVPTLSLDANDMKATSRNNARSPFLPRQALSNESVPMGGALVRLMQMAGPNEQGLTIRKSPPTLFVRLSLPGNPFSPLAHSARLPLCPLTQALCPNILTASLCYTLYETASQAPAGLLKRPL